MYFWGLISIRSSAIPETVTLAAYENEESYFLLIYYVLFPMTTTGIHLSLTKRTKYLFILFYLIFFFICALESLPSLSCWNCKFSKKIQCIRKLCRSVVFSFLFLLVMCVCVCIGGVVCYSIHVKKTTEGCVRGFETFWN